MARSRGQQAYAEWVKEIRQAVKELKNATPDLLFTSGGLDLYFQQYVRELAARFEDENLPNGYYWEERATQYIEDLRESLMDKLSIPEGEAFGKRDEDSFETTRQGVEYFGLRVLTDEQIETAKSQGATSRANVFPSIADVLSYIEDIPVGAIVGLEAIYGDDGEIEGFKIWLSGS